MSPVAPLLFGTTFDQFTSEANPRPLVQFDDELIVKRIGGVGVGGRVVQDPVWDSIAIDVEKTRVHGINHAPSGKNALPGAWHWGPLHRSSEASARVPLDDEAGPRRAGVRRGHAPVRQTIPVHIHQIGKEPVSVRIKWLAIFGGDAAGIWVQHDIRPGGRWQELE